MITAYKHRSVRIVALTEAGRRLGETLSQQLPESTLWYKPKPFSEKIQKAFTEGDALILICATGIAVRTLAPVVNNKYDDPPVLIMDELGQFVIPLLSGHEGGANDWAAEVAAAVNAQVVITTAKPYLKPIYTVGMGCERNCPIHELRSLLLHCLQQVNIDPQQIESISSIEIKADEQGLILLASELSKPFHTFGQSNLSEVEHLLSTKSDYVFNTVGVYGVAESAALVAAKNSTGDEAELILNKQKNSKATCAIARSYPLIKKENV